MSIDPELQVFVDECDELLADMEGALLRCKKRAPTSDDINAIFRTAHTIKGSAGLFGLEFIVEFVHEIETVLDLVRTGAATGDPDGAGPAVRAGVLGDPTETAIGGRTVVQ